MINEDADSYIVEDGKLLIIGSGNANLVKDAVPNIVRLKTGLPEGDWVATIKFFMPYQTGREAPFLAIYEDKDNEIVATTNSWSYYEAIRGARTWLSGWKRSKAMKTPSITSSGAEPAARPSPPIRHPTRSISGSSRRAAPTLPARVSKA